MIIVTNRKGKTEIKKGKKGNITKLKQILINFNACANRM